MRNLRLLIADDHEIVRRGLRSLIAEQTGWEVAGEAANGREAVEKAKFLRPDIIILDMGMPLLNGLEAMRQLLCENRDAKVIIITPDESDSIVHEVFEAGARGCLPKSGAGSDLVAAVNAVSRNRSYFSAGSAKSLLENLPKRTSKNDGTVGHHPAHLTTRQREVIQLLAEGRTSKEVGSLLGISAKTAETHRANIMLRLEYQSIRTLVRYAVRNNFIET